jgi:peptidyl-prolyl cis-trans isomerase B (cyclophilin B)
MGPDRPQRLLTGVGAARGGEVAGSSKRERQLAREHYLRQQARRAQLAARRRRIQQVTAVVVSVVVVVAAVAFLAQMLNGDDSTSAAASPDTSAASTPADSSSPPASPSAAAGECSYPKSAEQASKPVSIPKYDKAKAADYRKPFSATLKTNQGNIVIELAADKAPCTANSFRNLVTSKFYDSTPCHRLTTEGIFVLQCGDPTGKGGGGPGYSFGVENAPKDGSYPPGTVAMARTQDPNSNGSQFFLVYKDTALPDPSGYTIFGTITKGLDVVTKLAKAGTADGSGDGAPKNTVTIESATIGKG